MFHLPGHCSGEQNMKIYHIWFHYLDTSFVQMIFLETKVSGLTRLDCTLMQATTSISTLQLHYLENSWSSINVYRKYMIVLFLDKYRTLYGLYDNVFRFNVMLTYRFKFRNRHSSILITQYFKQTFFKLVRIPVCISTATNEVKN
jgi:hypothetical protein